MSTPVKVKVSFNADPICTLNTQVSFLLFWIFLAGSVYALKHHVFLCTMYLFYT